MPGFCEHVLLQDHHKLANYMLIIQTGGWTSAMKLSVYIFRSQVTGMGMAASGHGVIV